MVDVSQNDTMIHYDQNYVRVREVIKSYLKSGEPTREEAITWLDSMITAVKYELANEDHIEKHPTPELPIPEPGNPPSER